MGTGSQLSHCRACPPKIRCDCRFSVLFYTISHNMEIALQEDESSRVRMQSNDNCAGLSKENDRVGFQVYTKTSRICVTLKGIGLARPLLSWSRAIDPFKTDRHS